MRVAVPLLQVVFASTVLAGGVFAAAHTGSQPRALFAERLLTSAAVTEPATRISERVTLAAAQLPVPFVREAPLTPWIAPNLVEPSLASFTPPRVAPPPVVFAAETVRRPEVARGTTQHHFQAAARNGSTVLAVTATP